MTIGDRVPAAWNSAEHPYRVFVEEMNDGAVMVTEDGLILFCNRRFGEFLNVSVDRIIGQNIDSIPNFEVRTCLATLLTTNESRCDPQETSYFADGTVRTLKIVANRLTSGAKIAILVTDVTEARAREAALHRSNEEMEDRIRERTAALASKVEEVRESRLAALNMMEDAVGAARALERANRDLQLQIAEGKRSDEAHRRLATVVEQAAETIVITDLDGTIVYVNPAFERITGYTREEAIGKNPRILKSGKQTIEFYQQLWATIGAGRVWQGHFINRSKNGSLYEEEATISPVRDASGTIINYVAIKLDMTADLALAEQLRHSQKIEAIGTLAGGIAHDFNNLLQAMLSIVQLLKKKSAESPRQVEHLEQLEQTVRRGSQLTRQLLLFARRETSTLETVDLNQILRDLSPFASRAESVGLFRLKQQ